MCIRDRPIPIASPPVFLNKTFPEAAPLPPLPVSLSVKTGVTPSAIVISPLAIVPMFVRFLEESITVVVPILKPPCLASTPFAPMTPTTPSVPSLNLNSCPCVTLKPKAPL